MGFVLELRDVRKRFGNTWALNGADFRVKTGEIHALLGSNGAGKSTLMNIVSGNYLPDSGQVFLDGNRVPMSYSTNQALASGVAVVYQELALMPHLSVAENIACTTHYRRAFSQVPMYEVNQGARQALRMLDEDWSINADALVGSLTLDRQQLIEIARSLANKDEKILLLDEPTSSLNENEVTRLFASLRTLAREKGIAVVIVTHRMREIRKIADVCTVMRDGRTVLDRESVSSLSDDAIAQAMFGHNFSLRTNSKAHVRTHGEGVLAITYSNGQYLEIGAGQIVGLAGLAGSGAENIVHALWGDAPEIPFSVTYKNSPFVIATPTEAIKSGMAYITGDRQRSGLFASLPILETLVAIQRRKTSAWGYINPKQEKAMADRLVQSLKIKISDVFSLPGQLSGGNQQKALFARWLAVNPQLVLLEDPTRGIDIMTKRDIYQIIQDLARDGTAILWFSTDYEELAEVCDKIVIIHGGKPLRELTEDLSEELISLAVQTG